MIDRGDIRNRPLQQYLGFTAALVMVSSSIRLTAWLQNSKKRAERSERLMGEQSHRDYLRLGYLHHRLPVMGWLIITVITPTVKPSATKIPENWSWRTRQLLTCRCVSVMLRSMQNTRRSADAKAKWCSAWWCCRWSSSVAHQQSVSQCEATTPPAWIMQPPPTGRHLLTIIGPERGWSI